MKNLLLIISFISCISLIQAQLYSKNVPPITNLLNADSETKLYTDPQFGYRISCPDSGWAITDKTGIPKVLVVIKSKVITESFIPNVNITIEFLPFMMTAEQYGEQNRESLAAHGYEVLSCKKTIINHNTFYDLQCLNQQVSPPLQFRYLCLVRNRVGFIITCTVPDEHYPEFVKDFDFILRSFRFL